MTLLRDFMKELNFDEMKEKHLGDVFCIDFDHEGNRDIWQSNCGNNDSYYHIAIAKYMTKDDFEYEVKKIQQKMDKIEEIQKNLTITAENLKEIYWNHYFSTNSGSMIIYLLQDEYGEYCTNTYYTKDDAVIDTISVPIDIILNSNGILYQLSTQACKDIMNNEYDYHQFAEWEL